MAPNNPVLYFLLGVIKEQQEDLKGALADYQRSYELKPDDPIVVKQIEAITKELTEDSKVLQVIVDLNDNEELVESPKVPQEKTAAKKTLKPKRKTPLKFTLTDLMKYLPVFGPK